MGSYNPLENTPEFKAETTAPISNSITNRATGIFTQTSSASTPTGNNSTDLNSAQEQGVASGIGTAAQVGSSVIQGVAQSSENEKNRSEERQIAGQNRSDTLKQQSINTSMRKKQQEIEQKSFQLQKRKDEYDTKINSFLYSVKKDIENKQKLTSNVDGLFGSMAQNEQIKNLIIGFAKGNI